MRTFLTGAVLAALLGTAAHAETFGVSMALFDDNWQTVLRNNMLDHAASLPDVTLQIEDAGGDISRQQSQIENFIASGVDGMIVLLVDSDSGGAMSATANAAGVPLIFVNLMPPNGDSLPDKQAWVGSDEVLAGTLQATEICKELGGKGDAVMLLGQLGTSGQRGRTEGVHNVLATPECSGIKLVDEQTANYMRTPGLDLMSNWLTSGIQPKAVFANNDEMALGAIRALKAAGVPMDQVIVGGVDATKDALAAMKAGDLDVTVFQNAKGQGVAAIDTMLEITKGEPYEKKTVVPFELVTPANLADYEALN
ncbi:inositol transport system substrate-binding protein [Amaricoccus macauensis]|uniref:Inositol transport system substrate-binding protein n=1 Tax=Amaricoccus macauensis TaxID=57001 RepID=A0A840SQM7_9RHOB|nr:sugar ABC transporter substrate-binding protein [Amaricoccus macauensis]MBB5223060.1 inositol transport system substrate-binding protein [Amaricoccus macauensis]